MKCYVTGAETNNKWKGYPLCREVVELAKKLEGENGFLGTTMRERIIMLQQRWKERVAEETQAKPVNPKHAGIMSRLRELFNG